MVKGGGEGWRIGVCEDWHGGGPGRGSVRSGRMHGGSPQLAGPAPGHSAAPVLSGQCRATAVHTGPPPSAMPGISAAARHRGNWPWMGGARFAAVLFYADGDSPEMDAGGRMPHGKITKILVGSQAARWPARHPRPRSQLWPDVHSVDRLRAGDGQYPSLTVVPSAAAGRSPRSSRRGHSRQVTHHNRHSALNPRSSQRQKRTCLRAGGERSRMARAGGRRDVIQRCQLAFQGRSRPPLDPFRPGPARAGAGPAPGRELHPGS
jgi:hypothetical protein